MLTEKGQQIKGEVEDSKIIKSSRFIRCKGLTIASIY